VQQARPGSGCAAIGGFNRIHAILGASKHCIATHPSDMAVAMRSLDAKSSSKLPTARGGVTRSAICTDCRATLPIGKPRSKRAN
jgi:hypothetical protein